MIERIQEVLEEQGVDTINLKTPFSEDTSLSKDLALDSLDAMELITKIEGIYEISISDDVAQSLSTVGDLVNVIRKNYE